jgi:excisionase family DNA binding protein
VTNLIETPWLTSREAASYLRVDHRTLLAWARRGKVKAYTLSGTQRHVWRFRQSDLDTALMGTDVLGSESPAVLTDRRIN